MSPALQAAALLCTVFGFVAGAAVLLRTADVRAAVRVLLDFLLAAGLLRLGDNLGWRQIASAAAVVAVRRLLAFDLAR